MSDKGSILLYGGEVEIDFQTNAFGHWYKHKGQRAGIISVTGATGMIDKSEFLVPWAVNLACAHMRTSLIQQGGEQFHIEYLLPLIEEASKRHTQVKEEAADLGSKVHAFAEEFGIAWKAGKGVVNIEPPETEDERVLNGITAFLDWYNENHVEFLENEVVVYSREHDFVGKMDALIRINGKVYVVDYKTSKGVYSDQILQVHGYRTAWEEEHGKVDGAVILHFNKETGEFGVYSYDDTDYEFHKPAFLSCLNLKKWQKAYDSKRTARKAHAASN